MFGLKFVLFGQICWLEKMLVRKNCCSEKNVVQKKMLFRKICWSEKNVSQTKIVVRKKCWSEKFVVGKKCWPEIFVKVQHVSWQESDVSEIDKSEWRT